MEHQIFIAHTGQRLIVDPESFASLEDFKAWVSKNSMVSAENQILLNTNGKHIKYAGLLSEVGILSQYLTLCTDKIQKEIFIYDRLIVQSTSPRSVKCQQYDIPVPQSYHVSKPPDTLSDPNELEAWRFLFQTRRSWTYDVFQDCSKMADKAQNRRFEIEVIIRAASTAVRNVQKHVTTVDYKNALIQNWVEDIRKAQDSTGTNWNELLERLRAVSVTDEIIRFITGHEPLGKHKGTLESLIHEEKFQKSKNLIEEILGKLSRSCVKLGQKVDEIYRQSDELVDIVSEDMPEKSQVVATLLDPIQLLQDIEALVNKISFDCNNVLESQSLKTIPEISKCALIHTKKLLPSLTKRVMEMSHLLQNVTETRNFITSLSMGVMQRIASLTSMVSEVTLRLTTLEPNEEADDALQMLLDVKLLPITYASFLAEGIRREQWKEKIKIDSSTLSNELNIFQEEEARRRRKWQKSVGATLWGKRIEQDIPWIELSPRGSEDDWPEISNENLEDLLTILQIREPNSALVIEVSKIISDLKHPTKQQTRCAKAAFKAGSYHENSLGRSTLLVRGDDELVRILQEEGQKTASKLKTADSRVRRLENLLHQQTQVNCTTIGNIFQIPNRLLPDMSSVPNSVQSPLVPDVQSRPSSVSSHRFCTYQGPDEKFYQQKLLSLEAELTAERERSACLEKEILEKKKSEHDLKTQIEETNSTKKDLLKNLEAQQREFIEERKSLAIEIKRVQAQKEDLENDLDQYVISCETENGGLDEQGNLRNRYKQTQENTTEESHEHSLFVGAESEQVYSGDLTSLMLKLRQRNDELISRAIKTERANQEQLQIIQNIYRMTPNFKDITANFAFFADALTTALRDLVSELESTKKDAVSLKEICDRFECDLDELKLENTNTNEKLKSKEINSEKLREELAELDAKLTFLETELNSERLQISSLKEKNASIESNSESLRNCLMEEERKSICMNDCLTTQQFRIESLENEIKIYQEKYQSTQNINEKLHAQLQFRTSKVKDLSQRFFIQNDRLCKLLERLSYCIVREGKSITIQRLPKPERSNANDSSDPNSTVRRSLLVATRKKTTIGSGELEIIDWTHSDDPETEKQNYDTYLNSVAFLDIDSVCETIVKRIKDLEYTAKKFSRDARSYREKSHSAQKEAHEKIAFKNFKEGDLALFLPTRNQATGAWAAFNVGAPHYFLKEQDSHKLRSRDWLLARICKIEDRVVDLSKSLPVSHLQISDRRFLGEASTGGDSFEDDNPFDLSDGLRWYLIEATEERPGAPATPGLGKCTVASANIDATGSIRRSKKASSSGVEGINKTLSKNLCIRRDSNNSKKSLSSVNSLIKTGSTPADTASLKAAATTRTVEEGSEAHIIRPNSIHDGNAAGSVDRVLTPEVWNQPDKLNSLVDPSNST